MSPEQKPLCLHRTMLVVVALALSLINSPAGSAQQPGAAGPSSFVHPGLLHSKADLDRMKLKVAAAEEPWAGAWRSFFESRLVSKTYVPHAVEIVGRGVGSTGQIDIAPDAAAAYGDAIAWCITGDDDYGRKSIEILNAWSTTCKEINGKDAVLCAGIYGYKLANAAEIMRHCGHLWPEPESMKFQTWLRSVVYPVIKNFAPFANGNWDACSIATMMSIAVYSDDRAMFDRAVRYYQAGAGDGAITHYIISDSGQCQESGRDQGHTQLGLGLLEVACEIGYHQGLDMYSLNDNRLLKGLEYTAKYGLGQDVLFVPYTDRTGKYIATRISTSSRGRFSAIWELAYNHYHNRLGMDVPLLAQAAAKRRPEWISFDQPGNGTLLFSLPPFDTTATRRDPGSGVPKIPGPIVAQGAPTGNKLSWVASQGATGYTIKRAVGADGTFSVIAKDVASNSYTDTGVQAGQLYRYTVSAANSTGSGADTLPTNICAGLPAPWTQQDIGHTSIRGSTDFDGSAFTLEAAGQNIGGPSDEFHFATIPLEGDGILTARFVPQVPSQFAKFGLMIRAGAEAGAQDATLILAPLAGRDVEVPGWYVRFSDRAKPGSESIERSAVHLTEPQVVWGRLLAPYWLRLARSGDRVTASCSADGQNWDSLGSTSVPWQSPLSIGLAACSGQKKNSTTAVFDHISFARSGAAETTATKDLHSD